MNKMKSVKNALRLDRNQFSENIQYMEKEELFNISLELLRKDKRDKFDLEILQNAFCNIKFFQELQQKQGVEVFLNCLKKIKLKQYSFKQPVIKQGDPGQEFFIILKGKVGVYIRNILYDKNLDKEEYQKIERHPIMSEYAIDEQKEVNRMASGQSFGEIALLMASIVCLEDTICAILVKEDFNEIMANAIQKQLQKKMDFLQNLPGFENVSRRMLYQLIYSYLEEKFNYKDIVYKERSVSDKIYIVIKGEFKLYKKMQIQKDEVQGEYTYQQFNEKFMPSSRQANRQIDMIVIGMKEIFGIEVLQDKKYRETSVQCLSDSAIVWSFNYIQLKQKAIILNHGFFIDNLKQFANFRAKWYSSQQINIKTTSYDFKKFLTNLDHKSSQYTLSPNKQKSHKGLNSTSSQKLKQINQFSLNDEQQQKQNIESYKLQSFLNIKRYQSANGGRGRKIKYLLSEQNIDQNQMNTNFNYQRNQSSNKNRQLSIETKFRFSNKREDHQHLNTKKTNTIQYSSKNEFFSNKQNLIDVQQQKDLLDKLFHKQQHKPKQNFMENDKKSNPLNTQAIKNSKSKIKRGIRKNMMQVQSFFEFQECQLQVKKTKLNKMINQQYKKLKIDQYEVSDSLNDMMNDNLYNFLDENQIKKIQSAQNQIVQRKKSNIHDIFKKTNEQFENELQSMKQLCKKKRSYSQKYPDYNINQSRSLIINHK